MQQGVLRRLLQPDWRDIGQAMQELVYALNIDIGRNIAHLPVLLCIGVRVMLCIGVRVLCIGVRVKVSISCLLINWLFALFNAHSA